MGLILDSSVLIAGERRGETVRQVIECVRVACGDTETALSVVTIVELTHGIYRAKAEPDRIRRSKFVEELIRDMIVHPVSVAIAKLARRIEGEQATKGITIDFEDLVIGTTALHLGFEVATTNVKHFQLIPGLNVVAL